MNLADLRKPFPPDRISWRVGSTNSDKTKGMALAYIDARDVMGRLDEVCGAAWQCEYVPMPNGTCCCRIGLRIAEEWVWRSNGGANLTDSDKTDAKEMAEKGSYSDAFKRAAVLWGIGQYLYDMDSPWVDLEPAGRSFKIAPKEYPRLRAILAGNAKEAPKPAAPAPSQPAPPDAYTKAKEWVTAAETAIATLKTREAMAKWMHLNIGALDKVREADKGLYDTINIKISQRNSFIEEMAAA